MNERRRKTKPGNNQGKKEAKGRERSRDATVMTMKTTSIGASQEQEGERGRERVCV